MAFLRPCTFFIVAFILVVRSLIAESTVTTRRLEGSCSQQTCSMMFERLQREEAITAKLEETLRQTIAAISVMSTIFDSDPSIRSFVQGGSIGYSRSPFAARLVDSTDSTLEEVTNAPLVVEPEFKVPAHPKMIVADDNTIKTGKESEEDLITVTDNWRVEIKRVYRQMNDMYENMATWEKVMHESMQMQNEKMQQMDRRLDDKLEQMAAAKSTCPQMFPSLQSTENQSADDLRASLQCALPHLIDFEYQDLSMGSTSVGNDLQSNSFHVEVLENQTLSIVWKLPSAKCYSYLADVWIRVYPTSLDQMEKTKIPFSPISKDCLVVNGTVSLLLSTSTSEQSCGLPLNLKECTTYNVELVPNYSSLRGTLLRSSFQTVPNRLSDSMNLESLSFSAISNVLDLSFDVNLNSCSKQLDSVHLKIYKEELGLPISSLAISNQCFLPTSAANSESPHFKMSLSPNHSIPACQFQWTRMDKCLKYKIEVEPVFWFGDGENAQRRKVISGVSTLKDVLISEDSPECCNVLTSPTGSINCSMNQSDSPLCFWWISAQPNHVIWLTFSHFKATGLLKVYDGSYSNNPVLLSHRGGKKPLSVRSKSNNLFIEMTSKSGSANDRFEASYISVEDDGSQFISGCGDYIHGSGAILSSMIPKLQNLRCVWFVESESDQHTILLDNVDKRNGKMSTYSMMVYDGWSTSGKIYLNESGAIKPNVYSLRKRARIEIDVSNLQKDEVFSWRVSSVSTPLW